MELTRPPIPRLTINIGIVGHRKLPADSEAIREAVRGFLRIVKNQVLALTQGPYARLINELYAPEPRFVLLSSLAEGADSVAAEEALALGYELHVPLPMARSEYEKDFEDGAPRNTFHELLSRATRVFEICAAHPERSHAYADAARVVLNHSDVLLALWNKKDTGYVAGTAPAMEAASRQHLPVVHIHPDGTEPTSIIIDNLRYSNWQDKLQQHMQGLLLPIEATSADKADLDFARACAQQDELPPSDKGRFGLRGILLGAEKALRNWLLREHSPTWLRRLLNGWEEEEQTAETPRKDVELISADCLFLNEKPAAPCCPKCVGCAQQPTCPRHSSRPQSPRCPACLADWDGYFNWFDQLANAYSQRYRGGLVLRYVAPLVATACLACALGWGSWTSGLLSLMGWEEGSLGHTLWALIWDIVWFALQAVFLAVPIILQSLDRQHLWHRRFFSYRVVGEQLRQTCHLGPMGFFMLRDKDSTYRNSPQRWTAWYYRAVIRHVGMPDAVVDRSYIRLWLLWVRDHFVVHQLNYHDMRAGREGGMCSKLIRLGLWFFMGGIMFAVLRGVLDAGQAPSWVTNIFSTGALVVPALAVFFAGFCAYACYAKDQQVSLASAETLNTIRREMDVFLRAEGYTVPEAEADAAFIQPEALHFTRAYNIAEQIHECCKGELLSWEDLISTRSINRQ